MNRTRLSEALAGVLQLGLTAVLLGASAPLEAQTFDWPLAPRGRLLLEATPSFLEYASRFGLRLQDGRTVENKEPLAFDFTSNRVGSRMLPHLTPGEEALQALLDDPDYRVRLGVARARMEVNVIRVPVRIAVGVLDRLTVGGTVPFVRRRRDADFHFVGDTLSSNAGLSPAVEAPASVTSFLNQFGGSIDATRTQVDSLCLTNGDTSSPCVDGRSFLQDAQALLDALSGAYEGSLVFPLVGSLAGQTIASRVAAVQEGMSAYGITSFTLAAPLVDAPLDEEGFQAFLMSPLYGVEALPTRPDGDPIRNWDSVWELGDVEVFGAFRFLDLSVTDSARDTPRFRYQGTAGLLVRLGTGKVDDPDNFVDLGTGDGQTDVELQLFNDLALGRRLGLGLDLKYGIQQSVELDRRIAAPWQVFPALASRQPVEWTPGNYWEILVSPRVFLTPEFFLAARYRTWSKEADEYDWGGAGPPETPDPPEPALLAQETEASGQEVGGGVLYSAVGPAREGRARFPFEAYAHYDRTVSGMGGRTPNSSRLTAGFRLYVGLWGGN